ncbi:hypothetical protein [Nocardia sp. NPDC057668]|uniref:hypothetical protein n=1 Tax=Nocardia sp. NPDC057668 TaxID=3346202 RepID=UPI00366D5269
MADDVSDEVVRAKAGELEGALSRWKLEGFDPVAGLDLAAAARLTAGLEPRVDSEGTPLIIVDMDGEYSYSVHLSTQAVAALGRSDFGAMLGAAVAAFPDVAAIVQPLSDFIATHAGEIEGQAAGGPVRLEGTVPSPFVVPVPESPVYWEVEHQIAEEESGSGRQSDDSDLDKQLKDQLGDGNGGWEGNPNKDPLHRKHRGSGI